MKPRSRKLPLALLLAGACTVAFATDSLLDAADKAANKGDCKLALGNLDLYKGSPASRAASKDDQALMRKVTARCSAPMTVTEAAPTTPVKTHIHAKGEANLE